MYDASVGDYSAYFRGNDIQGNSGNGIELSYNASLYDGQGAVKGNNNLDNNGSHEVYLSSSNARWYGANGGSYSAVGDNTSSKFVYNLA